MCLCLSVRRCGPCVSLTVLMWCVYPHACLVVFLPLSCPTCVCAGGARLPVHCTGGAAAAGARGESGGQTGDRD